MGIKGDTNPLHQGLTGDRDTLLPRGNAGSSLMAAACPEHKAAQAVTALNHTLPMGIAQGIYPNIYYYELRSYSKPVRKAGPDLGSEIQYFMLEIQARTLGEDINSPHSLHKNLVVAAHRI